MTRPASFDTAVMSYCVNLRANALKLTRNRDKAEDLVQDTIERALRYHAQYTEGTNLIGWLFTIMQTRHLETIRKNWRVAEDPDEVYARGLTVPPDQEPRLMLQDVNRCLEAVHPLYRESLLLAVDGMPYADIAHQCGTNVGTIKSRVSRARAHLAEMVA
jgi:RNA polymerase sigma-70 factor (ECF subfamily)